MRTAPVLAVVTGLAAVAAAVLVQATASGSTRVEGHAVHVADRGTLPASSALPATRGATAPVRHGLPAGTRLRYTRLGIDAPVVATSVHRGVLHVPRDPHTVGWWSGGAGAGDTNGSVVVAGHVNYAGTPGALGVLPQARPGDVVALAEPGRSLAYRVQAVRVYPKTQGIPAGAFARTGPARLVLITCGGPFDAASGNYLDNVVVYAGAV